MCTILRETAARLSEGIGMHSKAVVQCFSSTENEEGVGHDFLGKKIHIVHTYGPA
jgi:hypothetical protein